MRKINYRFQFLPCLLLLSVGLFLTAANVKYKTFKITEGVTAKLPSDFVPMSDDDIAYKYPSTKKPLAMFTNSERLVDFGLNVSKSKFPGNDLKILQQIYKATLLDMYQKVQFKQEQIKEINKKQFIVFEFTSQVESQRTYTYLLYTLVKDQVYLFNFSCPFPIMDKWQTVADKVMNSIKMHVKDPIEVKPPVKEGVKKYQPKVKKGDKNKEVK